MTEVEKLRGENKALVLMNKFLRERPDLPVDRIPAYQSMMLERLCFMELLVRAQGLLVKFIEYKAVSNDELLAFFNDTAAVFKVITGEKE